MLDEAAQDAATAISGSGPAYVALFVDALAEAGSRRGSRREVAYALAIQTFKGTAELLARDRHGIPQELIDAVSSPGGTTVAALEALEAGGLRLDRSRRRRGRRAARKGVGFVSVLVHLVLRAHDFYELLIIVYVLMSWFRPSPGSSSTSTGLSARSLSRGSASSGGSCPRSA